MSKRKIPAKLKGFIDLLASDTCWKPDTLVCHEYDSNKCIDCFTSRLMGLLAELGYERKEKV